MPVAVDPTPAMAVSQGRSLGKPKQQGPTLSESVQNPKQTPKKQPRKDPQNVQNAPIAGPSKSTDASPWSWKSLTESSASRIPPLFSKDGNYFFSASASSVKVYSTSTGHIVSTLVPPPTSTVMEDSVPLEDNITSMALNPHNPFQLYTTSIGGFLRIWNVLDGVLLRILDVGQPIHHIVVHGKFKDEAFLALTRPRKIGSSDASSDDAGSVVRISLSPTPSTADLPIQKSSDMSSFGKTRAPVGLAISSSGTWLVAIAGHTVYCASASNSKAGFTKFVSPERLTCLTFHPKEEYFATGDDKGVVRLWYCLNDNMFSSSVGVEKKSQTTALHWHAHAVSSVAFTANGAYLLSGGEEAVLVIWQLHSARKEFIPRVGAPIMGLAVTRHKGGDEEYLLSLADASFVFVRSATLRISRTISRIKLDPTSSHHKSTRPTVPFATHLLSSTLILPSSHPSSLQFYDPTTSRLLSELEVSPSNRVSRRDEKALEPSRVEKVAVSGSGDWMVTVDTREGDETSHGEVYLKMWSWDVKSGSWTLNTRIDRPHGLSQVTAVAFRPKTSTSPETQLVTTGRDGNIKVWRTRTSKSKNGKVEEYWVARSSFMFRSTIPSHASWSADGSILSVSQAPHVVLYDPTTCLPIKTLTCPECNNVFSAHSVGRSGRYLAAVDKRNLVLWDLVTQTVRWHYRSPHTITGLTPHPKEETFCLLQRVLSPGATSPCTNAQIFTPSSNVPTHTKTLPFYLSSQAPCPTNWSSSDPASFALVGITSGWNVVVIGDDVRLPNEEGSTSRGLKGAIVPPKRTVFQDMFGASALVDVLSKNPLQLKSQSSWKGKEVEKIFDTAAYLMPPLDTLFDTLMDSFCSLRPAHESDDEESSQEDQPDEMDVDKDDEVFLAQEPPNRLMDQAEMNAMVDLFRNHSVRPLSTLPANGITHTNGTQKGASGVNGLTPRSSTAIDKMNDVVPSREKLKSITPVSRAPPPDASLSSAVATGQKRKKSLGS